MDEEEEKRDPRRKEKERMIRKGSGIVKRRFRGVAPFRCHNELEEKKG